MFLTKKQRTSVLCVILALLLVVSRDRLLFGGADAAESGRNHNADHAADSSANATPQEADSALPVMDTVELIAQLPIRKRRGLNCTKAQIARSRLQRSFTI